MSEMTSKITIKPKIQGEVRVAKVYPELESLVAKPSLNEQYFKPEKYGYSEVKVTPIEENKVTITPRTEGQSFDGVYTEITVNPIQENNLVVNPKNEQQTFSGVYTGVTVNEIQGETLEITPSTEPQTHEGLYGTVNVAAIKGESLNITPKPWERQFEGVYTSVTVEGDSNLAGYNIRKGTSIFGVEGSFEGVSYDVPIYATPGTTDQIYEGSYNKVVVEGDSDLIPENIKKGVTIFGVEGTLEENVEPEYMRISYIEGRGSQYIDTGIIPTNHKIEIKFQFTSSIDNKAIFGSNVLQYSLTWFQNQWYVLFNGQQTAFSATSSMELQTLIFNDENNKVSINGNKYVSTGDTTNPTRPLCLFTRYEEDGSQAIGYAPARIYYVKITDKTTGELVRDMIPVKHPNDIFCLYDKVSKAYFYNQGTGTFSGGI